MACIFTYLPLMMHATVGAKNHRLRTLWAHAYRVEDEREEPGWPRRTRRRRSANWSSNSCKSFFSLVFPLLLLTLCAASFILSIELRLPEFGLWAAVAFRAVGFAQANTWFAVALGLFALASLPLTWLALREQELRASKTLLAYVIAAIVFGFLFWLRTVWPYDDDNGWQMILYGAVMFCGWRAVVDAAIGTLGIVLHIRCNRPRSVAPPRQEPHGTGAASDRPSRHRNEPETI